VIKRIESEQEQAEAVKVLRRSFGTVADEYGISQLNAPTNPAFATAESMKKYLKKPGELYGLFEKSRMIGCVAIEPSKRQGGTYYIERLAVIPERRHLGHGDALISFALRRIAQNGGHIASIGIMNENRQLKEWYLEKGFVEVETKRFSHVPFEVCYMSREVSSSTSPYL
jgi:ribosomal protein S18 acetylase RimI-like enzyme